MKNHFHHHHQSSHPFPESVIVNPLPPSPSKRRTRSRPLRYHFSLPILPPIHTPFHPIPSHHRTITAPATSDKREPAATNRKSANIPSSNFFRSRRIRFKPPVDVGYIARTQVSTYVHCRFPVWGITLLQAWSDIAARALRRHS